MLDLVVVARANGALPAARRSRCKMLVSARPGKADRDAHVGRLSARRREALPEALRDLTMGARSKTMGARPKPPRQEHYCLFDTAIGTCGVAWSAQGLTRLQLPESDRSATEKRLRATAAGARPETPPPPIVAAITEIQRC